MLLSQTLVITLTPWCNGELTDVKHGIYHTKATFTDIDGWVDVVRVLSYGMKASMNQQITNTQTLLSVQIQAKLALLIFTLKPLKKEPNDRKEQYDNIQIFYLRSPTVLNTFFLSSTKPKTPIMTHSKRQTVSVKAKQEGNLELADIIEIDYNNKRSKISNLRPENMLDEQSFVDHTLMPMSIDHLWTDNHSAITCSGLGDGSYDCFIAKDGDQIVRIKLDYFYYEDED